MTEVGVIVPVYQGDDVVARSLGSLAAQRLQGSGARLHVVVAVNDGRPEGVRRAERIAATIRRPDLRCVVCTSPPGRGAAFAAAELHLPDGPRIHLDQDAILSPNGVVALARVLAGGTGVHFATGRLRVAPTTSALSRAYYTAWSDLPYVRRSPASAGLYAFSMPARSRWDEWPDLHSDDKWVRMHFAARERARLAHVTYEVVVPSGLRALVRARRRYLRGNREVSARGTVPFPRDVLPRHAGAVRSLVARPSRWPASTALVGVHALATAGDGLARAVDRLRRG